MLIGIEFLSERLWSVLAINLGLMIDVSWPTIQIRELIECRVVVGRKLILEEYMVARRHVQLLHVDAERAFIERSKSLLINAPITEVFVYS